MTKPKKVYIIVPVKFFPLQALSFSMEGMVIAMEEKRAVICKLMDFYAAILSKKQREVLELYYYEDLSLAEIAENFGITRQGVRDTIKHGEEAIFTFENKLELMKKSETITKTVYRIIELTDDEQIKTLAREILAGQE